MGAVLPLEVGVQTLPTAYRDTVRALLRQADAEGWERGRREATLDTLDRRKEELALFPHLEQARKVTDAAAFHAEAAGVAFIRVQHTDGRAVFDLLDPAEVVLRASEHPGAGA